MLLIGSRAIRYHYPEFREPRDWDLVATQAEIDELATRLPLCGPQRPDKAHFKYGDRLVEVGNASVLPYWSKILDRFSSGAELEDPVLGTMVVAPPGYLLLTKHCGLVYRVVHWHKNLEDLYFLRDKITTMPPEVADLVTDTVHDSARMFAASHERANLPRLTCHPASRAERSAASAALHDQLHSKLMLANRPAREEDGAWEGFTHAASPEQRTLLLQRLFAEEGMVVAAQARLESPLSRETKSSDQWLRWALRSLCIGELPVGLRYFVVNYYREIRDLVPENWYERAADLVAARDVATQECRGIEHHCSAG